MNDRAQRVLEFHKILSLLEANALTDGGKALCRELRPENELKAVTRAQAETEEAVTLLSRLGGNPLTGVEEQDGLYHPERNAFNNENGDVIAGYQYARIRNAAGIRFQTLAEDGSVLDEAEDIGQFESSFYYTNKIQNHIPAITKKYISIQFLL